MKSLVEYINNSMLKHIAIELKNYDIIYEKYGEYNGCDELASYIIDIINKHNTDNDILINYNDVKNIDNIKFSNLTIKFDDLTSNIENTGYLCEKSEYDSNNKLLTNCIIIIPYILLNNNKKLHMFLEHELQHMFDDCILHIKGFTSLYQIINKNNMYERSKKFNDTNTKMTTREVRLALYILNNYEQRAFIAQLCDEIRKIKKQYFSDKEINSLNATLIYNMTKDLEIYRAYENVSRILNRYYTNHLYKNEILDIENEWYEMTGNEKNIEQIIKYIEKRLNKIKNKLESVIPKKIAEELNNEHNSVIMDCGVNIFDLNVR